jgi:hypothetical protein
MRGPIQSGPAGPQESCGSRGNRQSHARDCLSGKASGPAPDCSPTPRNSLRERTPRTGGRIGLWRRTVTLCGSATTPRRKPGRGGGSTITAKALFHNMLAGMADPGPGPEVPPKFAASSLNTRRAASFLRPPSFHADVEYESAANTRAGRAAGRRRHRRFTDRCGGPVPCRAGGGAVSIQSVAGELRLGRISKSAAHPRAPASAEASHVASA